MQTSTAPSTRSSEPIRGRHYRIVASSDDADRGGRVAEMHFEAIKSLQTLNLTGVCDRDRDQAAAEAANGVSRSLTTSTRSSSGRRTTRRSCSPTWGSLPDRPLYPAGVTERFGEQVICGIPSRFGEATRITSCCSKASRYRSSWAGYARRTWRPNSRRAKGTAWGSLCRSMSCASRMARASRRLGPRTSSTQLIGGGYCRRAGDGVRDRSGQCRPVSLTVALIPVAWC